MRHSRTALLIPLLLLILPACQSRGMRDSLHWYRNAAEMRAAYEQTYVAAARALRPMVQDLPRGSWGVIMDVDETVLDNSDYAAEFRVYTPPTWDQWTARRSATALPGAKRFTELVRGELGGQVVFVTNREQKACADTEANLQGVGVGYDRILCMRDVSDKNPRFATVQAGSADAPAIQVLMWFGDNIGDFPQSSQTASDLQSFGTRYFVLPNPVYGSWENLPRR